MPRREALTIEVLGESFRFYFDLPGVLHINRVHGTTPEEAIQTFFTAERTIWGENHLRFETITSTHGLYWTRHAHDGSIIVISYWERRANDEQASN